MDEYEITSSTLMLEYYDENKTRVYEFNEDFIVNQNILEIVENSCYFYGSTLEGRTEASKKILNTKVKVPIVVEDMKKIIFFPTKATYRSGCNWLSFNNIDKIERVNKNNSKVRIFFCNGLSYDFNISYDIVHRQLYNCLLLEKTLILRQENA